MLKGISKVISPELLKILSEMGHGDELVIADGNFPSGKCPERRVRADGHGCVEILDGVLSLIPVDTYSDPNLIMMELMDCDKGKVDPKIWKEFEVVANKYDENSKLGNIDRFEFYERAKKAYAVVQTSEMAIYANIIVKKGVVK